MANGNGNGKRKIHYSPNVTMPERIEKGRAIYPSAPKLSIWQRATSAVQTYKAGAPERRAERLERLQYRSQVASRQASIRRSERSAYGRSMGFSRDPLGMFGYGRTEALFGGARRARKKGKRKGFKGKSITIKIG